MASIAEISNEVFRVLNDEIHMDEFAEWSAEYAWNIHQRADNATQNLAYLVRSLIVAFESGDIAESEVRDGLRAAIAPQETGVVERTLNFFVKMATDTLGVDTATKQRWRVVVQT